MRTLQDYRDIYRQIANNLNLKGDSVELLVQMLANSSYISEVENIVYMKEASLEKSSLPNSKIHHCMNLMYSVYRGQCPRILIKIQPKSHLSFEMYDVLSTSNNFKVYYLGYYKNTDSENATETVLNNLSDNIVAIDEGFNYGPLIIDANDTNEYTLIGLLAKETVEDSWSMSSDNTYYVESTGEDLSNDVVVKVNGEEKTVTRNFSDHLVDGSLFDLTTTSFGSRIYLGDLFANNTSTEISNTTISATYYVYSELSDYNEDELKRLKVSGAELVEFDDDWLSERNYDSDDVINKGILPIECKSKDDLISVHYKANKNRYENSIIRSNSEIGTVLEEDFPNKIKSGGTTYEYSSTEDGSYINIYYVPINEKYDITTDEAKSFTNKRKAYYVTDQINIIKGTLYQVNFMLKLELYNSDNIDSDINDILDDYSRKFNVNIEDNLDDIKALISKISNVKKITNFDISFTKDGTILTDEEIEEIDLSKSYFDINYEITTVIQSNNQ